MCLYGPTKSKQSLRKRCGMRTRIALSMCVKDEANATRSVQHIMTRYEIVANALCGCSMFLHCLAGPTRKHMLPIERMFPIVKQTAKGTGFPRRSCPIRITEKLRARGRECKSWCVVRRQDLEILEM